MSDETDWAQRSLTSAIERSRAARQVASPDGRATETHLKVAAQHLDQAGHRPLASRLRAVVREEAFTTSDARVEMREVAQLIAACGVTR